MNVHCYQDNWQFRFQHILDFIIQLDPDLIALQEVCSGPTESINQFDYIRQYLSQRGYPTNTFEGQYTHPAWGKYDESLLMISKHRNQWVDKGFLPASKLQRGYIGLLIDGRWYINTHLEYHADNAQFRKAQFDFLRDRYQGQTHVLMGDFNSSTDSMEQADLWQSGYQPLFPGYSHNGEDGNGSHRIDGFWLSPTLLGSLNRYEGHVMLNEKVQDQYLSDHYAVFLSLFFR